MLSHFESDCFGNGHDVKIGHFRFDPEKQLIIVLDVSASASAYIFVAILYVQSRLVALTPVEPVTIDTITKHFVHNFEGRR